jgi:hypothetical protein
MHFQAASLCAQGFLTEWLENDSQRAAANDSSLETDGPTFTRSSTTIPQEMVQLESRYLNTSRPAQALPGFQPDVMVITARRNERRLSSLLLGQLKAEDATVETQRPLQVGHLQMDVADAHP